MSRRARSRISSAKASDWSKQNNAVALKTIVLDLTFIPPWKMNRARSLSYLRMDFRTQSREIIQRPPAERRKARTEDEARVGEIGVGDDALGDDSLRLLEIRLDQFLAQIGSRAAGPAFARLAVFPEVKAAAGFPAEVPGGDERGELLRRLGALARELLADREADVEADRVGEFDRPHRHAERSGRGIERLRRDALIHHAQRPVEVRSEHAVDEKTRRILHRQRQLVDLPHEGRGFLRGVRVGARALDDFHE